MLWNRGEIGAISPLFHNIMLPVVRFYVQVGTRFSLRDKQLFEICEVEITSVNCIMKQHFEETCFYTLSIVTQFWNSLPLKAKH